MKAALRLNVPKGWSLERGDPPLSLENFVIHMLKICKCLVVILFLFAYSEDEAHFTHLISMGKK